MKVKEIIEEHKKGRKAVRHNPKPRNPVAANSHVTASSAGAHKDKKKAEKQGDVKHKQKEFSESVTEGPLELNTPNPVVVIQDLKGKILDKLNLSVAAQKYKLGQPQDIKKQLAHQNYTTIGNYVIVSPMSGQPQDKTTQGVAERVRDPEDWDEGNTEPPNNFAVYINDKKWKVFAGRGTYADDYREKAHYQQLKDWAAKKSAATGKKWTVHVTGEPATA